MRNATRLLAVLWLLFLVSCKKETRQISSEENQNPSIEKNNSHNQLSPAMILKWNDAAIYVVLRTLQLQPTPRISPFRESHYYATVNLAVHDALNNIVPQYETYALHKKVKSADPDAAVATAAHNVISYFFGKLNPPANNTPQEVKDSIDNLLAQSLNSIPNSDAKLKGIALGNAVAEAVLEKRANDGSANAIFTVTQGINPGEYRSTPPFDATGFYDSPGWGNVMTFGILSSTQFPVPANYAVNSAEYTADYNEIKQMGCATCTGPGGRTQDQENIAKFWVESSAYGWNKIGRELVSQKNLNAWETARLLALLQMSIADAYIACLKAKMTYYFWRPITAIRLGNSDGNPNTVGDPAWQVLVAPTPPIADHPSAHATAGGAAAALLSQFFNSDNFNFSFSSITLPGNPRSFTSLSQAARENSLSRIYVGYHFRKAVMDGEQLGTQVGQWIATHSLQDN